MSAIEELELIKAFIEFEKPNWENSLKFVKKRLKILESEEK